MWSGVQREKWPVDPFGAIMKDGYIWGRGSRDDKPILAANLMVMLLLKRSGVPLDRDVIFLAESGEEADVTGVGINFMVNQHFDEIDAEFSLTEGGGSTFDGKRVTRREHRNRREGPGPRPPGRQRNFRTRFGSAPGQRADSSGSRGREGGQVGNAHAPERHHPHLFRKAGHHQPAGPGRALQQSAESAARRAAQRYLAQYEPGRYSMLRTSVVPTMMKAGVGPNVIPSEAEATLDIRALPDENISQFYSESDDRHD